MVHPDCTISLHHGSRTSRQLLAWRRSLWRNAKCEHKSSNSWSAKRRTKMLSKLLQGQLPWQQQRGKRIDSASNHPYFYGNPYFPSTFLFLVPFFLFKAYAAPRLPGEFSLLFILCCWKHWIEWMEVTSHRHFSSTKSARLFVAITFLFMVEFSLYKRFIIVRYKAFQRWYQNGLL